MHNSPPGLSSAPALDYSSIAADARDMEQPVTLGPCPGITVLMRPRALKRAIVNIVDNAIRYGGKTELSLTRDRDEAVIRIADHGHVAADIHDTGDELEHHFEPVPVILAEIRPIVAHVQLRSTDGDAARR